MAKHAYVVKVPKPHPKSYNPDRPINALVQNQLFHLSVAERQLQKRHHSGIDVYAIDTEAKAAAYIQHVTKKLHLGERGQARFAAPPKKAASRVKTKRNKSKSKGKQ